MPITISLPANDRLRACIYAFIMMTCMMAQFLCIPVLNACQHSVFKFHTPNVTSVTLRSYRDIPYNNCRCSFTETEHCLTHLQLQVVRALPLILFVIQVYVIREHISFSGNHAHFLVNLYWVVSTFSFFVTLTIINRSSPHYVNTAMTLSFVGSILFCIVVTSVFSRD